MAELKLVIPPKDRGAVVRLFRLSDMERQRILDVLRRTSPSLSIERFISDVQKASSLPSDIITDIVQIFYNLYNVMEHFQISPETLSRDFAALTADYEELADAADITDIREQVRRFIHDGLNLHSTLGVSAKALRVMLQHQRVYSSAELFTDIRTVFDPGNMEAEPQTAILVHNLKLTYVENEERKQIYLALDQNDLRELAQVLQRALQKQDRLRNLLKASNLNCLEPEENER